MSDKLLQYVPGHVPASGSQALDDFLRREFQAIRLSLQNSWDIPLTTSAPERETRGMVRYADGVGWDPGSGEGLYIYTSTGWVKV